MKFSFASAAAAVARGRHGAPLLIAVALLFQLVPSPLNNVAMATSVPFQEHNSIIAPPAQHGDTRAAAGVTANADTLVVVPGEGDKGSHNHVAADSSSNTIFSINTAATATKDLAVAVAATIIDSSIIDEQTQLLKNAESDTTTDTLLDSSSDIIITTTTTATTHGNKKNRLLLRGGSDKTVARNLEGSCPEHFETKYDNKYYHGLYCDPQDPGKFWKVSYGWQWGEKAFSSDGQWARCKENHDESQCEQLGAVVYVKCPPGFTDYGCCMCEHTNDAECPKYGLEYFWPHRNFCAPGNVNYNY